MIGPNTRTLPHWQYANQDETEIGDWKMPDFKMACAYAASQGWLIVQDDVLTLTSAGLGGPNP